MPCDGSRAKVLSELTDPLVFKSEFLLAKEIRDPFFVSENDLLFFCGTSSTPTFGQDMDLYLYRDIYGDFRNVTNTAKEIDDVAPFDKVGDLRPAGLLPSRDGKYLFFFRGHGWNPKLNLVGLDLTQDFKVFDLTGSEFSAGFIPDLAMDTGGGLYQYRGPAFQNVILAPLENSDALFFTAKYFEHKQKRSQQIFMLNTSFPLAAFPVTSFDPLLEEGIIDNLAADETGQFIAFSRSNQFQTNYSHGAFEKVFVVDLAHGAYMRDLTPNKPYNAASVDGSFRFVPSPSADTPAGFIYGVGAGGNKNFTDNPPLSRIWLYPLEGVSDSSLPSISYPLTEEGQHLLFFADNVP